jgi:hypothetical protein
MASRSPATPSASAAGLSLDHVATFPGLRALAWSGDVLYASRGYSLMRATMSAPVVEWERVGVYSPVWWRNLSCAFRPTFRLFRDGFHALAVLSSGHLVAAVPGAIITLRPREKQFQISHRVLRGTRPLHIAVAPDDQVFWGEYFDNPGRDEVHIYNSTDRGATWNVVYTFPQGAIRHVHNIVYDAWQDCLWVLTGDNGAECRIVRASCDFKNVEAVLGGNQQARAVALIPRKDELYFSSDTPLETNHVYCLDRRGTLTKVTGVNGSSIYGCGVGEAMFFSTMVEPSAVNLDPHVGVYGSRDGRQWQKMLSWKKDIWPMGLFQYGNAILPGGRNTGGLLAVTTIAVDDGDCDTGIWRVTSGA